MNLSSTFKNSIYSYIITTNQYVGLFNGVPSSNNEITNLFGSRLILNYQNTGESLNNSNVITFANSTGTSNASYIGIFDSISDGNLLYSMELSFDRTINIGDTLTFNENSITFQLS